MPRYNNRRRKPRTPDKHDITLEDIDYKNLKVLKLITSNYAKILPKSRTGLTSKMQRKAAREIKRARVMSILPYTRY